MRRGVVVLVVCVLGCGDGGGSDDTPPIDTPPACQVDDDCGELYCTTGTCGARPRWTDAAPVGGAIPSPLDEQSFPSVRADNLEIIFASTRSGGMGCLDLWRATRSSATATFGTPELITNVASAACEAGPALTADGGELLFFRDDMAGNATIMRSTRPTTNDPFGAPTEVPELSVDAFNFGPSLSGDGLVIVFQAGAAPGPTLPVLQAERTSTTAAFGTPRELTELSDLVGLGVGLDPSGRYMLAPAPNGDQLVIFKRTSPTAPFDGGNVVQEIMPNPAFPALGSPFVTRDGAELYFTRRTDNNHVEIWAAKRE